MLDASKLSGKRIAVSVSDSPDLAQLGLSSQHLHQAMAEIAQYLLASGAHLIYGGDLRANGFTSILFELAARYQNRSAESRVMFTNYLPWATHVGKSSDELLTIQEEVEPYGKLVLLSEHGKEMPLKKKKKIADEKPSPAAWAACLTAMRDVTTEVADARVLLGGSVSGFLGSMPGIAEEALFNIRKKKPTYLLGGFGGCASDIVETIAGSRRHSKRVWAGRKNFKAVTVKDLVNGLSPKRNEHMSTSPFLEVIIPYLLSGLDHKLNGRQ